MTRILKTDVISTSAGSAENHAERACRELREYRSCEQDCAQYTDPQIAGFARGGYLNSQIQSGLSYYGLFLRVGTPLSQYRNARSLGAASAHLSQLDRGRWGDGQVVAGLASHRKIVLRPSRRSGSCYLSPLLDKDHV